MAHIRVMRLVKIENLDVLDCCPRGDVTLAGPVHRRRLSAISQQQLMQQLSGVGGV